MTPNEITRYIAYHKKQLLRIATAINPDYPLGAGLAAEIKRHQEALRELSEKNT